MGTKTLALLAHKPTTIQGWPDEVAASLETARRNGVLVTDEATIERTWRPLPDGQIWVPVTLLVPETRRPRRMHPVAREVGGALAKASAFVAVVGMLLVAVAYGIAGALAQVPGHVWGALAGVAVIVVVAAANSGKSKAGSCACILIHICRGH